MLILTRSEGEALLIGDNIEIVIVSVNGAQVRIGTRGRLPTFQFLEASF